MSSAPQSGDTAPPISLPTDGGGTFDLSAHSGGTVVVYFYPKDDTNGCTREAIDFSSKLDEFEALGARIVGISPDDQKRHDKFKAKHDLKVTLASDTEKSVSESYGVWIEKSMYGRKYMGVERSTFLIGPDGRIVRTWRKVKVPGHVDEVLEAVRDSAKVAG